MNKIEDILEIFLSMSKFGKLSEDIDKKLNKIEKKVIYDLKNDELLDEAIAFIKTLKVEEDLVSVKNNLKLDEKKVVPLWRSYLKYVAILMLCFFSGYMIYLNVNNDLINDKVATVEKLTPISEKVTLTLSDGRMVKLDKNQNKMISTSTVSEVESKGGELIFRKKGGTEEQEKSENLKLNTLHVPKGLVFNVVLPDGSKVWLNADSSIKFPELFTKNNRTVMLEGEAYFDVQKDKSRPFIVQTGKLNVEVLGTHFNVMNYPDETRTNVVLVEGSVKMYDKSGVNETKLSPGMMGVVDKKVGTGKINTSYVNTSLYTGWLNGRLIYRDLAFNEIIKKLERKYNVVIINNNLSIGNQEFSGNLGDESIEQILAFFKEIYGINYTIRKNTIYIN